MIEVVFVVKCSIVGLFHYAGISACSVARQWEMGLQGNAIFHCVAPYTQWSLNMYAVYIDFFLLGFVFL